MATPAISEYLKFINLQMAAESLFGFNAVTAKGSLKPGEINTGAIDPKDLTTGNLHPSKFTAT